MRDLAASLEFVWACRAAGLHGEAIRRVREECRRGVPVKEAVEREVKAQAAQLPTTGLSGIWIDEAGPLSDKQMQVFKSPKLFVVEGMRDRMDERDQSVSMALRSVINRGLRRLARVGD